MYFVYLWGKGDMLWSLYKIQNPIGCFLMMAISCNPVRRDHRNRWWLWKCTARQGSPITVSLTQHLISTMSSHVNLLPDWAVCHSNYSPWKERRRREGCRQHKARGMIKRGSSAQGDSHVHTQGFTGSVKREGLHWSHVALQDQWLDSWFMVSWHSED